MVMNWKSIRGKVITACGPIEPEKLGAVMMHEHLHSDIYDWLEEKLITREKPISRARSNYLMDEAVPFLKACNKYGCFSFVDATMPPWRAWPTFYVKASRAANMHIILCTGFYREVESGTYWVKKPEDSIWPFVKKSSVEQLAEFCIKEILKGIHGTNVHAGAIKLGTSVPDMTDAEKKAFKAGARAQKATGVHITTHCARLGSETSQLKILDKEGVDLNRVVIGHTAWHLMDKKNRKVCMEWMKCGANFLPTNMGIRSKEPGKWRPLVDAIHQIFDAGLGAKIAGFGLDWAFVSESNVFGPCNFIPPPPFLHMFTQTLPAFRKMGLTKEEEKTIMVNNPYRILPVQ